MLQMKNCVTYRLDIFHTHTHLVHDLTTSDAFVIHSFVVRILTKRVFICIVRISIIESIIHGLLPRLFQSKQLK